MVDGMLQVGGELRNTWCEGCSSTELGPNSKARDKMDCYFAVLLRILFLLYYFEGISWDCA